MIKVTNIYYPRFLEGAAQSGCLQKLRDLAASIKNTIFRFFQYILPCLFKKKPAPLDPSTINPNPPQIVKTPLPLQPQPPIQQPVLPIQPQPVVVQAVVQQPPPVQESIQQPAVNPPPVVQNIPQPVEEAGPKQAVPRGEEKQGNINAIPANNDERKEEGNLSHVVGTKGLSPQQSDKGIFVILNAFNRLWSFIENKEPFKGGDLDAIVEEAIADPKANVYIKPNERPPFRQIVENEYKKLVIERIVHIIKINRKRKDKSIRVTDQSFFPLDKMIKILTKNAKDKKCLFGAVLIAKYPIRNPPVYGLFAKYNETEEERSFDLYLLDPYKGKNKFISFQKVTEQALRSRLPNVVDDDSDESDNDIPVEAGDANMSPNVDEAVAGTAHYSCIPLTRQSNRAGNGPLSPNNALGIDFGFDTMFE